MFDDNERLIRVIDDIKKSHKKDISNLKRKLTRQKKKTEASENENRLLEEKFKFLKSLSSDEELGELENEHPEPVGIGVDYGAGGWSKKKHWSSGGTSPIDTSPMPDIVENRRMIHKLQECISSRRYRESNISLTELWCGEERYLREMEYRKSIEAPDWSLMEEQVVKMEDVE